MSEERELNADILIDDASWAALDCETLAARAFERVAEDQALEGDIAVSLRFTSDGQMQALNKTFRQKDRATNVLSWPEEDLSAKTDGGTPLPPEPDFTGEVALGDIALGFETCLREAREAQIPFENHVTHLLIHGLLHLLGYDHIRDKDATLMEQAEIRMLETLGIPSPYETE